MFENIQADVKLESTSEEEKTPTESLPEDKKPAEVKSNVSEDEKTPDETKVEGEEVKKEEEPFHKHSRFKELVKEKNELKSTLAETKTQIDELRQQIADSQGQKKAEVPEFESFEDITKYIAEMPNKIKEQIVGDLEANKKATKSEESKAQDMVTEQLNALKDDGKEFKEDELIKFALEYKITDLSTALTLMDKVNKTSKEALTKGEQIGKRKKDSGLKSTPTSKKEAGVYNPGQSLDDIIEEGKKGLK
jgi:hypothetical protein|tara:strand:- start:1435 stop:2181 length:747 start_codon:yes stop_codon:yes gene_type:complete